MRSDIRITLVIEADVQQLMEKKDLNLFVAEFLPIRFKDRDGEITRDSPLVFLRHLLTLAENDLPAAFLLCIRCQEDDLNVRLLQFLQLRHHLD